MLREKDNERRRTQHHFYDENCGDYLLRDRNPTPNPYPGVYVDCKECSGRGKIIHQGDLSETTCPKCEGNGWYDPFAASTATPTTDDVDWKRLKKYR